MTMAMRQDWIDALYVMLGIAVILVLLYAFTGCSMHLHYHSGESIAAPFWDLDNESNETDRRTQDPPGGDSVWGSSSPSVGESGDG